jgi:hypothetical protein
MAINLNDNIATLAPKPSDNRYGPWVDVPTALIMVSNGVRYVGLTVGIGIPVVEYWWESGIADEDLVIKSAGGGGGTNSNVLIDGGTISNPNGYVLIDGGSFD